MSRAAMSGALISVFAVVASGGALATITISPRTYEFQAVLNGQSGAPFNVRLPASTNPRDSIIPRLVGADASEFSIEMRPTSGLAGTGPSTCPKDWRSGSCTYVVVFRPTSPGRKKVNLGVTDAAGSGNVDMIPLTGIAAVGCRPLKVPCNYLDLYEGVISSRTALETAGQNTTSRTGRWITETTVTIAMGTVWCQVTQNDEEQENNGGRPRTRSSESGTVVGEGFAAIEFRPLRQKGIYEYTLKFACPTPGTSGTSIDYEANTSSTFNKPGSPLKWDAGLAVDPHPVKDIGAVLAGKQIDPYENIGSNDGVQGGTTTTWSLKRWQ